MKVDSSMKLVKGMRDIIYPDSKLWNKIEDCLRSHFERFNYQNIRTPILEKTKLFVRSVGEGTDIVDKEMYHFSDQGGDEICLRPELTAGIVRSLIESGEIRSLPIKTWSIAPAFRRERPQKGRYRQFWQADIEVFGIESYQIETELILLTKQVFIALGLKNLRLEINTLGDKEDRQKHANALNLFFKSHFNELDEDSQKRVDKNPLRILDSKNPKLEHLIDKAPKIDEFISEDAKNHFENWKKSLKDLGIDFAINPKLVRGIDYYNRSVFEWISLDDELGSGSTICGGGRYDYLVGEIGQSNQITPAIGFAIGLDRLVLLIQKLQESKKETTQEKIKNIWVLNAKPNDYQTQKLSMELLETITNSRTDLVVENHLSGKKINKQFEKAQKEGADLIITVNENANLSLKDNFSNQNINLSYSDLANWLNQNHPK